MSSMFSTDSWDFPVSNSSRVVDAWDDEPTIVTANVVNERNIVVERSIPVVVVPDPIDNSCDTTLKRHDDLLSLAQSIIGILMDAKVKAGTTNTKITKSFPNDVKNIKIDEYKRTVFQYGNVDTKLKIAVVVYGKHNNSSEVSHTAKTKIAELKEALSIVSSRLHSKTAEFNRSGKSDEEMLAQIETLKSQENNLRTEIGNKMTSNTLVSNSDLVNIAKRGLKLLAKDTDESRLFHDMLLQRADQKRFNEVVEHRRIREIERKKKKEDERAHRDYMRYIDKKISKFSRTDEQNFEKTKEMLRGNRFIPHNLKRYVEIVDAYPYLSFTAPAPVITTKSSAKPVIKTEEFPTLGSDTNVKQTVKSKARDTSSRFCVLDSDEDEEQTCVPTRQIGAWTQKLDTEMLKNLPDQQVHVPQKQIANGERIYDMYNDCMYYDNDDNEHCDYDYDDDDEW